MTKVRTIFNSSGDIDKINWIKCLAMLRKIKTYKKYVFAAEMINSHSLIPVFNELYRQYNLGGRGQDTLWMKEHNDAQHKLLMHAKSILHEDNYCDFYFEIYRYML
jgi:hypothetical protein